MNEFSLKMLGEGEAEQEEVTYVQASGGTLWRTRVAPAVRALCSLPGPPLTGANVKFLDNTQFAAQFPAASLAAVLLKVFLAEGDADSILRDNHLLMSFGLEAHIRRLRPFIQGAITRGFFEHQLHVPPDPTQTVRVTPRQLVAGHVGGFTTGQPFPANRTIFMQVPGPVETFVHEVCHFYGHGQFNTAVNARSGMQIMNGMLVLEILSEGLTEFFARRVMQSNPALFGPIELEAYQGYFEMAARIVATTGEPSACRAYFHGVAADINRVFESVRLNIDAYPLLVPPFMIP
jgi:hypothetical protein